MAEILKKFDRYATHSKAIYYLYKKAETLLKPLKCSGCENKTIEDALEIYKNTATYLYYRLNGVVFKKFSELQTKEGKGKVALDEILFCDKEGEFAIYSSRVSFIDDERRLSSEFIVDIFNNVILQEPMSKFILAYRKRVERNCEKEISDELLRAIHNGYLRLLFDCEHDSMTMKQNYKNLVKKYCFKDDEPQKLFSYPLKEGTIDCICPKLLVYLLNKTVSFFVYTFYKDLHDCFIEKKKTFGRVEKKFEEWFDHKRIIDENFLRRKLYFVEKEYKVAQEYMKVFKEVIFAPKSKGQRQQIGGAKLEKIDKLLEQILEAFPFEEVDELLGMRFEKML